MVDAGGGGHAEQRTVGATVIGRFEYARRSASEPAGPQGPEPRVPNYVSIIIPTHNALPELDEQLGALAGQDYTGPREVIVSDNGSTDGLRMYLAHHPLAPTLNLRWVDASDRDGAPHARNVGSDAAQGDLLVYAAADDRVHPQWLSAMVSAAGSADAVGGVIEIEGINTPEVMSWRPIPGPEEQGRIFGYHPVANGCTLALWRTTYWNIGGWNEDYALGGDDYELCLRLGVHGLTLAHAPEARVAYRLRDELDAHWRRQITLGRMEARLYADYREHGMPRRPPAAVLRTLGYLIMRNPLMPKMIRRNNTGIWLFHAATLLGRMRGSLENRVLYF